MSFLVRLQGTFTYKDGGSAVFAFVEIQQNCSLLAQNSKLLSCILWLLIIDKLINMPVSIFILPTTTCIPRAADAHESKKLKP